MSNAPHDDHAGEDITPMMIGIGAALLLSMVVGYFVAF
jgi:hypothetical protein